MAQTRTARRRKAGASVSVPYQATRVLFDALIWVEGSAGMYAQELARLQERIRSEHGLEGFTYIAPPRDGLDEKDKALIESRRAELTRVLTLIAPTKSRDGNRRNSKPAPRDELEFRPRHWYVHGWYDSYHRLERHFRKDLDRAWKAVVAAAPGLDDPSSDPLKRTTTQIRTALQELGGSYPRPMVIGDIPPTDAEIPVLVMKNTGPISVWIDKLRPFVHPSAPTGAPVPLRKRLLPPAKLPDSYLEVLQSLKALGAVDKSHRQTAAQIAHEAVREYKPSRVKNILADLARWLLVESGRGTAGGSWLTEAGLARLRPPSN